MARVFVSKAIDTPKASGRESSDPGALLWNLKILDPLPCPIWGAVGRK